MLDDYADMDPASRSFVLHNRTAIRAGVELGRYRLTRDEDPTAHRYRPQHPLAVAVLGQLRPSDACHGDLTFDYSDWGVRAEQLAPLVGMSGVMRSITLGSTDSSPRTTFFSGVTDDGGELNAEQIRRLLDVPRTSRDRGDHLTPAALEAAAKRRSRRSSTTSARAKARGSRKRWTSSIAGPRTSARA